MTNYQRTFVNPNVINDESNCARKHFQQPGGYFKRKRENEDNDESPSKKFSSFDIPQAKRLSANDRLKKYREELKNSNRPLRMHELFSSPHSSAQRNLSINVNNDKVQNPPRQPKPSSLQDRMQQIRNNKFANRNVNRGGRNEIWYSGLNNPQKEQALLQESATYGYNTSNNAQNENVQLSVQERVDNIRNEGNTLILKPLKSNLPDTPVDYKAKCMNYLKTNCNTLKEGVDLPFYSLITSSSSTTTSSSEDSSKNQNSCSDMNNSNELLSAASTEYLKNQFTRSNTHTPTREKVPTEKEAENRIPDDSDVLMEWAPFDENIVLSNIQDLRARIVPDILPNSLFQKSVQETTQELPRNSSVLKNVYIIIDTNIFISHLKIIQQLLEIKINEAPIIFIPWIVIQELDYIKDGRSGNDFLKAKAQAAIKQINIYLQKKSKQFQGQSVKDAIKQQMPSTNADDSVLNCCLQIMENNNRAILLSNDTNLRNKALINKTPAYGPREILDALDPFNNSSDSYAREEKKNKKIEEIKINISHLLTLIIVAEMKEAYKSTWSKMPFMNKPPWSLEECLERLLKYWGSVFSYVLQKQAKMKIEEFKQFLSSEIGSETKNLDSFVEHCLTLCLYLKNGFQKYQENISDSIAKIQDVVGSS